MPLKWFKDWYHQPKYNLTFDFPINSLYCNATFEAIKAAYIKSFPKKYQTVFHPSPIDMFTASRWRTCPLYLYDGDFKKFKESSELRPLAENKKKYNNYSKVLMNYGPWKSYWGDRSEFDALEYWIKVLGSKFPNNPYTLCPTAYVPFLYKPWISNPDRPPLSGQGTLCVWNLRPIVERNSFGEKTLSIYGGWRQSRTTYFLGNIYGIIDIFHIVSSEVYKRFGKSFKWGVFYGHVVGRENDCRITQWNCFQTELMRRELM